MPPVSGNAPATSASVRAPQSATTPPAIHTLKSGNGPGSRFAMPAGVRKIPEPIVMPMTTATALQRPSCRGSVPGVERGDGSVIPNATPGWHLDAVDDLALAIDHVVDRAGDRAGAPGGRANPHVVVGVGTDGAP